MKDDFRRNPMYRLSKNNLLFMLVAQEEGIALLPQNKYDPHFMAVSKYRKNVLVVLLF